MQLLSSYDKNKDVKISLITRYSEYEPTSENVKIYEIHLFKIPLLDTIYFYFKSIFDIIKIHKKEKIDVLNIHTFTYNIISLFIIRVLLKIPILMKVPIDFSNHLRDIYISEQQRLKSKIINYSWLKFFKIFVLKKINFVRILNKKIYKDLIELKYPMDCILEIPNGITSKEFISIKKIQNPDTHYGYVGRLTEFKNVKFLLDVFKEYLKKYPSDKLFIYGTGPDENFILNFIEENHLSNNIVLMGFEKDKTNIYSNLNVLIDPATAQGISNSNLEAMCSKTLVIASEVVGNRDLIKHGKTGFLFELNKGEDLLNNLLYYKEHPKIVQEILNKANLEILNKYDIDVVTKQIIEFLKLELRF